VQQITEPRVLFYSTTCLSFEEGIMGLSVQLLVASLLLCITAVAAQEGMCAN
jgi:hypothetical protein